MFDIKPERIIEELEKDDFGIGDLTLLIACTKCDAFFSIKS